jgi:hypothetical protein
MTVPTPPPFPLSHLFDGTVPDAFADLTRTRPVQE